MRNNRNVVGLSFCALLLSITALPAQELPAQERPAAPTDPEPTETYNTKVMSRRTTTPNIVLKGNPPQMIVTAYYEEYGTRRDRPKSVSFFVMERHQENLWEVGDVMKLRAGDKTYTYASSVRRIPVAKVTVEVAIVAIPVAEFQEIVRQDAVHFQVRQTSDTLEKAWLEPLRRLSEGLPKKFYVEDRPVAPPPTPATSYDEA